MYFFILRCCLSRQVAEIRDQNLRLLVCFIDKEKLSMWIQSSGHQVVGEVDEQLQWNHRLICSNHFNPEDYKAGSRPTLSKNAVPKCFNASVVNNIINNNTNNYNNNTDDVNNTISSRLNFDVHCDSNECQNSSNEFHEHKQQSNSSVNTELIIMKYLNNSRLMVNKLRKKNNVLRQRIFRLRRSTQKWNYSRLIALAKTVIKDEKTSFLVEMQISHLKKKSWSEEEKNFALSIYQRSSQCYKFLRNEYNMALPCVTLIRKWINEMQEF
ncbi:PREDICTED: myb-like protein D isoform X2 [Polistes canadensis]|uniref:myb-like protein D isoform X2 n=2 Tax=Polistes canadensis TaxID=91411 RepID=UPI000718F3CB|nr:PREDICTED: myb-like protein D isoform X2 [Polistes canadensis]